MNEFVLFNWLKLCLYDIHLSGKIFSCMYIVQNVSALDTTFRNLRGIGSFMFAYRVAANMVNQDKTNFILQIELLCTGTQ